ncbi:hypothetical protein A5893_07455 [Pedobacter psychrophilus]|uniref:Uncharacterized protein n=1 Tax=Pedobacter psychrophilus TaxID=1826909 RepID=A0A179DI75_9SPHI|nr:DUF5700 domain-containing putative Zn-dependent protease [Pedobacter psychrophilus]OAQ40766.1 hypothetical protein A5893_07455 [Pedobacter psychrophilus]
MKKLIKGVIIFVCLLNIKIVSKAQTIDFAPLDAYWKLIEPLKSGDSLSLITWKNFLDIEPNKIYVQNQGFDNDYLERLRKTIQLVYMSKNENILAKRVVAIDKDPSSYWLTYKVYVYKKYEKELKAFQNQLINPSYIPLIYKNSFEWLPKKLQNKDGKIDIHFLGIENDAIAGDGIVITTLWTLYNQDKLKMGGLLGHEMHHVLRKPITFPKIDEQDLGIIYFINATLNEGTADMIDKVVNIEYQGELPMGMSYKDFELFQADSIVAQVDINLIEMQKSEGKIFKTEKDYRNLVRWTSGHCPGYYMTDIVVRQGYKKRLMQNIQNPFEFIYLYNKAAKKDKEKPHVFSDEAIAYIKLMENKYWKYK